MADRYRQFVALRLFPTGRRLFALKNVRKIAGELGDHELCMLLDNAITADSKCLNLERAWRTQVGSGVARGEATKVDPLVDRLIASIVNRLTDLVRALRPSNPVATKARAFMGQWFPNGAVGITSLPYEEQLEEIEGLLSAFADEEIQKDLALFGLTIDIQELTELLPLYRTEIQNLPPKDLKYATVVEARHSGQNNLLRAVIHILVRYDGQDQADSMEKLLAPILDQEQRLAESAKTTKKLSDVDPDTGHETHSAVAP